MESRGIRRIDIDPFSFEVIEIKSVLGIDVRVSGIGVIGSDSISWFGNSFLFDIVKRKSSVS